MDFLTVVAAAGAGYVAKYLQKVSKENERKLNSGQQRDETSCDGSYVDSRCLGGNVIRKKNIGPESTSDGGLEDFGSYQDCNILSLASFPLGLDEKDIFMLGKGSGDGVQDELGECSRLLLPDSGGGEVEFSHSLPRGGRLIRYRRPYKIFAKPLNSLESCMTAQLFKQHSEMESYLHTSLPSPFPRTRPLLVTDGKRVISRATSRMQTDTRLVANRVVHNLHLGAPRLPKRSMEMKRRPTVFQRRMKQTYGEHWPKKLKALSASASVGLFDPLADARSYKGSCNRMHLFLMGVTVGILSTFVANKREMDKLNNVLKQSNNLVQDLQEEIEIKHLMTVKELVSETVSIKKSDTSIFALEDPTSSTGKLVDGEKYCLEEDDQTAKQSEIMNQIEAELEAELERLELNMIGSTLERVADFVELDPDYEADFAKGEFRLDTMTLNEDFESDEDNLGSTSSSHTDYANRPVSPRELSLRLHKVIEERLEVHVKELETALEDSQKRVRSLEHSKMKEVCSKNEYSSPDEKNIFDQPLVINLAGDALDAYNEAYEEIFRMLKTEDETPPDTIYEKNEAEPYISPSQSQNLSGLPILKNISFGEKSHISSIEGIKWKEHLSENIESDDGTGSEDDDILGKLLIQQIVEKTRQGSSLVLKAQRKLYSMDE